MSPGRHFRSATARERKLHPRCMHYEGNERQCSGPVTITDYSPTRRSTDLFFCERHASWHRSLEVEDWLLDLEALGEARVIQVTDLGAALEAREHGGQAVELLTGEPDLRSPCRWGWPLAAQFAATAAHLARVALGEVAAR